ncbi:hypothetical protein CBS101457_001150 [Exobasidium rhododendri]|nr:hypothetical protein CBS101457_001150 [Exobasidium rhododendri]
MSAATIEEFDDDTDFALPVVPATPAGGSSGMAGNDAQAKQMQEFMAKMQGGEGSAMMGAARGQETELSAEAKKWVTIYPIYFDAKRKYMKGCRRVAYDRSCLWPKSDDIQAAVQRLDLKYAHEPRKTHPQDWENPGRVKVQLFDEGGAAKKKQIESKKALLNAIAGLVQSRRGGKPPSLVKSVLVEKKSTRKEIKEDKVVNNKNAASGALRKTKRISTRVKPEDRIKGSRPPPLNNRYPVYSPAREAGLLNADLGGMMGDLQGMGPLGAMMGSMGLGGNDEEEDAEEEEKKRKEEEEKQKKKDPMAQLGRRQRKRVVRIGR